MNLRIATNAYLRALTLQGHSQATREYYNYILKRLTRHFGNKPIHKAGLREMTGYLSELKDSGLAQSSFNTYVLVLKRFFGWLVEQGHIKANPLASFKVRKPAEIPVMPFSEAEIKRLIAASKTPLERCLVLLLLDCGLRARELSSLRVNDVNLATNTISVKGKGGYHRRLALNDAPRRALKEYLTTRVEDSEHLWGEEWGRKKLSYILDKLGRRAQVAPMFPHRFRNTWATMALSSGMDLLAVKTLGGWRSLTMVERYVRALESQRALEIHKQHSVVA